jgi:hypothetical protein
MSYVEQTIAPDERVVHKAKFHWLYTVVAWLAHHTPTGRFGW